MNRLISRCVLAFSASVILSTNVMAADAASCQNVRMGVVNWTDVIATSAMTQVLLDGLGYKTKQTSASQQIIFAGIRDQRLDLFLGGVIFHYYQHVSTSFLCISPSLYLSPCTFCLNGNSISSADLMKGN